MNYTKSGGYCVEKPGLLWGLHRPGSHNRCDGTAATGLVLTKAKSASRRVEVEPDLRDPLAVHALNDECVLSAKPNVIAQSRLFLQAGADEIGKRGFILRFGDLEAVERRDAAKQHFAGEREPPRTSALDLAAGF